MTSRESAQTNRCQFWDCDERIQASYVFCYDHHQDLVSGQIDECPGCGRGKYVQYEECLDCHEGRASRSATTDSGRPSASNASYRIEHSDAWGKRDEGADEFYVYMTSSTFIY